MEKKMNRSQIEVVLTNWKRKNNLPILVEAMRHQSVSCSITLVDNAEDDADAVDLETARAVDKYFRIKEHPYGPALRYACHGFYDAEYLFVCDDDLVPGKECLAHFLSHIEAHSEYGVLGQFGRNIYATHYGHSDVPRVDHEFVSVSLCVCAYFLRKEILTGFDLLKKQIVESGQESLFWDDDMLLSASCQLSNRRLALTPMDSNRETYVKFRGLPQPFALSAMSNRAQKRMETWNNIQKLRKKLQQDNT